MAARRCLILLALFAVVAFAPAAWAQPVAQSGAFDAPAIYERAAPAVATIRVMANQRNGVGTGFVIDASGVIITAAHVARQADRLVADFGEGEALEARLIGYDARRDLAMLRVAGRAPLPSLEVIDSTAVRQGDPVIVIGTPRGRPRVMTTGAVRGTGLTLPGQAPEIFIAFDAAVAPGNSGGPLLNDRGQVIGVVVAGSRQEGVLVGLAVSSSTLRGSLAALADGARLERPWIGIIGATLRPEQVRERGLAVARGILVREVVPESPAQRAGLRGESTQGPPGDVIVAIDGEPVGEWEDLLRVLGDRQPGQKITLGVLRGQARIDVPVVLDVRD